MKSSVYNRNIILILAASFCYMACPMMVTPLITGYAGVLGAGGIIMGLIGGLMNICSLVMRPVAGNLSDRTSKYKLSILGATCMFVACIGYIISNSAVILMISRLIHGIGFSCCSVCMSTWMAGMLPKEKIGSGMGIFGTMNALSMAIAPSIGIKLSSLFGYRTAFATAAGFALLTLILIQFISDHGQPQKGEKKHQIRLIIPRILPLALIVTLFTIPYCATQSFLISYIQARGINVSTSLFFPVYALVLLGLRIGLRKYFDTLPFRTFLIACTLSSALAILLLNSMTNNLMLFAAAVFMAAGYGIMCSVAQSTAILMAKKGESGMANSTYYVGLDIGMSLGPILGGFLYSGLDITFFYPAFLITIPLILAMGLLHNRISHLDSSN